MLAFISDLHFTDGSCGATLPVGACELLAERIADLAVRASWRASGNYEPIERVDLVLLGDTLDLIQSTRWLQSPRIRPWSGFHWNEAASLLRTLLADVLRHNEQALSILKHCGPESGLAIPQADSRGRPFPEAPLQPVAVHLHYVVGDHDWLLHLPGPEFDGMRHLVARKLGLADSPTTPFPHEPDHHGMLGELLRRHRVVARHGDQFDPLSFAGRRDLPSLVDALLIELLLPFVERTRQEMADDLPQALTTGLCELAQVRPLVLMPAWLDALLDRLCRVTAMRHKIERDWDQAVDRFLALDVVRRGGLSTRQDLATAMANLMKFGRRPSGNWAAALSDWWRQNGGSIDSLASHAAREHDFRNRRARYVVYGHSHLAEMTALEASSASGFALQQIYFNTGTWRRAYRPTHFAFGSQDFVESESFSLVVIYQADERGGRGYETWTGSLGVAPSQMMLRVDAPRMQKTSAMPIEPTHSTPQPAAAPIIAPTSAMPVHGPHFVALPTISLPNTPAGR